MSQPDDNRLLFKIIIIGDSGVGKSCILYQYTQNEYKGDYNVTIGVEFASKTVDLDANTHVKLQIWDTAGQESFRSIVKSFYRNAAAVFLVYNITKRETFTRLTEWLQETRENSHQNVLIVLVGNQNDRKDEREVQYEEGVKFMKENDLTLFFETSAKSADNIDIAFRETAKLIFMNYLSLKKGPTEKPSRSPSGTDNSKIVISKKDQRSPTPENNRPKSGGCC